MKHYETFGSTEKMKMLLDRVLTEYGYDPTYAHAFQVTSNPTGSVIHLFIGGRRTPTVPTE